MSSLEDLKERARLLLEEGHSPGQIADELSLSIETVTWLLTQPKGDAAPHDVHIDWTRVSCDAQLIEAVAAMMIDAYIPPVDRTEPLDADVIVGIAISGIPLATLIGAREGCSLAVYHPAKHAVVAYLRRHGGVPVAIWVLFDKRGITEVEGVPVHSLFRISRID
ncbi:MAG: PyrE-like protein [Methanocalculus sp. 52_23]|nr:MAG: PyrE-like protein [Methanocalculus sp. 52_23]